MEADELMDDDLFADLYVYCFSTSPLSLVALLSAHNYDF